MTDFVHLHLHTQYSLLDGLNKVQEVVQRAAKFSQPAIAITDHGNMHGAMEFYEYARKAGVHPIIGCELYVTSGSRFERLPKNQGGSPTCHLTALAENETGYRNLCRMISLAYSEGFYSKPRVDHELLERFAEGLIILSGCLSSELGMAALSERDEIARKTLDFYAKTFRDRYYLEIQPHAIKEQQQLNALCAELAKEKGIPLVATTDCHYGDRDDHHAQEVLMCISTGKKILDPDRMRHEGVELHFKTGDEMKQAFRGFAGSQEAIANTLAIAERCKLTFDENAVYMPRFDVDAGKTLEEDMAEQAREGLRARFSESEQQGAVLGEEEKSVYHERLEEEILLIQKMGFSGYFLVVSDFIVWAKNNGVPVGPGRGSAAGSLVAYALRITEVDPIRHKLLFERFLNPDRVSLPDIDVDFCIHGRDRVIQYVVQKYGKEKVAQIATFGTLKAKAALKDIGRVLGVSYAETDRVAKLVPTPRQGFDYALKEALEMEPRLKEYAEGEGRELVQLAMKIEGLTRHASTHAAGVVIGDRPLVDLLPMMLDKDGNDVTQYSMKYVEKVGLVKFDFLGLKTLTVLHACVDIIRQSRQEHIDLNALPLDDAQTYEMLASGKTTGVFQLESSGITEMTMRLKPTCFDDLVAILALYRPGPLDSGMADHYIERKNGREGVSYVHPLMETILADTYGIILYQEQIMQLARTLAGYSLAEADLLRRAMGKKNPEEMAKQKTRFLDGAKEKGIAQKIAEEIFSQMETFARYGFNRSHSAAYAMISYQTAYLKAHYNVEFMAALMSNEKEDTDKTLKNLNECRKQKIVVLPPDINSSTSEFRVEDGKIRYGLTAVKGIGEKAVQAILHAREKGGAFVDFEDIFERVDAHAVNKRVFEGLIKCGACDSSQLSRAEMLDRLEDTLKAGQSLQREADSSQLSLFGENTAGVSKISRRSSTGQEFPRNIKLAYEREALGFYISGHPLTQYRTVLERVGAKSTGELEGLSNGTQLALGGVVTALRLKNTKKGERYASFLLEDWEGTLECLVWPNVYRQVHQLLASDDPVLMRGRLDVSEERRNFIIDKVESLMSYRDQHASRCLLRLKEEDKFEEHLEPLLRMVQDYQGNCPLFVELQCGHDTLSVQLRDERGSPVCVEASEELSVELEQHFGRPVASFV